MDDRGPRAVLARLEVELEHGSRDPQADVTHDEPVMTGKIAWAHLKEIRDYCTRPDRMEAETELGAYPDWNRTRD